MSALLVPPRLRVLCINCGCEDGNACDGGCTWLRVDRDAGLGVCSSCPEDVERWDAGDRSFSPELIEDDVDELDPPDYDDGDPDFSEPEEYEL